MAACNSLFLAFRVNVLARTAQAQLDRGAAQQKLAWSLCAENCWLIVGGIVRGKLLLRKWCLLLLTQNNES